MHNDSVEERALEDGQAEEEPFAPVNLPAAPANQNIRGRGDRHSRPLPPPGGARRIQAPKPPPRPEHTLTAGSRPIPRPPLPNVTVVAPPPKAQSPTSLSSLLPVTPSNWSDRVTLTQPRPEPNREKNLYTEAPKKLPHKKPQSEATTLPDLSHSQTNISVIPTSPKLKSKLNAEVNNSIQNESIFCQKCGKCRCEACVKPRKLPQKWLCSSTVLCSKKTIIDGASCMCCVKGLFYHCTKDSERGEIDPNKEPCACTDNHSAARWGIMLPLVPLLPCLLAYPVLSACAQVTESVYAKCTASGCQCQINSEAVSVSSDPSLIVESQPQTLEKKQLLSKPKPSL